jgi:hypothetical protein
MEVSGQFHALAALPPRKEPLVPVGGPQSRSGRGGEEKNSQSLPRLVLPIIQPVAQRFTTELYQLLVKMAVVRRMREVKSDIDRGRTAFIKDLVIL